MDPELVTIPPDFEGQDEDGKGWWYHLRDGFLFRGIGEDVTIALKVAGGYSVTTVTAHEWASVVAAVSKRGDVASAFKDALNVHQAEA